MFVHYNVHTRQITWSAWLALQLPTTRHFVCSLNAFCIYCSGTGHKIHIPSFPDSYPSLASAAPLPCFRPFLSPLHFFLFGNLKAFPSRANGRTAVANDPWKWCITEALLLLISKPHSETKILPTCKAWARSCHSEPVPRGCPRLGRLLSEGKSLWCREGWGVSCPCGTPAWGQQGLGTKLVAVCFPFSPSRPRPTSGSWTSGWTKSPLTRHPS